MTYIEYKSVPGFCSGTLAEDADNTADNRFQCAQLSQAWSHCIWVLDIAAL